MPFFNVKKNKTANLSAANSPLTVYDQNVGDAEYLEGAVLSDQDCKLVLYQGNSSGDWISTEEFTFSADTGEPFSFAVTCQRAKLELVRVSADANVKYEINHRWD